MNIGRCAKLVKVFLSKGSDIGRCAKSLKVFLSKGSAGCTGDPKALGSKRDVLSQVTGDGNHGDSLEYIFGVGGLS